jgi:hypothetical protein
MTSPSVIVMESVVGCLTGTARKIRNPLGA